MGRRGLPLLSASALLAGLGAGAPSSCRDPQDPWCADGDGSVPDVSLLQAKRRGSEASGRASAADEALPNVLIIFPDDMYVQEMAAGGWTDLAPPYPSDDYANWSAAAVLPDSYTTIMNRIASEGATFRTAYSASSYCAPSRWSLLMGRYPSRNSWAENVTRTEHGAGVATEVQDPIPMSDSEGKHNIASIMQGHGYMTGMVGKWGLAYDDETYDTPYASLQASVQRKGFDYVDGLYIQNLNLEPNYENLTFSHNLEWVVDHALTFMEQAISEEKPFFLYFAPMEPHLPPTIMDTLYYFDEEDTPAGRLTKAPTVTRHCKNCDMVSRDLVLLRRTTEWSSTGERPNFRKSVTAAIFWLDSAIGALYHFLKESGQLDNTYMILTTDHGEAKGSLYEQGIRVPQFVRGPSVQNGVVITEPVSLIDIVPTILEWVGAAVAPSSPPLDGLSWAKLASGDATSLGARPIFAEIAFDRAVVFRGRMKYYTQGIGEFINNYTLMNVSQFWPHFTEERQLYDLQDPGEQYNLLGEETSMRKVQDSLQELGQLEKQLEEHNVRTLNTPIDF